MDEQRIIRVGVNGAKGRMGMIIAEGIRSERDMQLAFEADRSDDLADCIASAGADVVVDFTVPGAVFENTMAILRSGASPVVGTTGLTAEEIDAIDHELLNRNMGGIYAPNFSLGALLMMRFAEEAARYMMPCEIIELHHEGKLDSPSGTALMTADRINERAGTRRDGGGGTLEDSPRSRGLCQGSTRIHSVRLPGLIAQQQVIYGGSGETLTLVHNVTSRACFLPGVLLAVRQVLEVRGFQQGMKI
jgi:4-hydroxy-tetrahydrodipicolinate reductase